MPDASVWLGKGTEPRDGKYWCSTSMEGEEVINCNRCQRDLHRKKAAFQKENEDYPGPGLGACRATEANKRKQW